MAGGTETLVERTVSSRLDPPGRRVWTFATDDGPALAAIVFLDGELYVDRVGAPAVVRRLRAGGLIPPAICVFVSSGGAAARHADFTCRPAYADFVAGDLLAWVRRTAPRVGEVVLAGLSLSGLAAAHAATRHPRAFRAAVCQSPSFWWERGRFADEIPPAPPPPPSSPAGAASADESKAGESTPAGPPERSAPELWVCVGSRETESGVSHPPSGLRQEMTQVAGCAAGVAALRARGYGVSYREYDGGHDPACWAEDLALDLPWAWRSRPIRPAATTLHGPSAG